MALKANYFDQSPGQNGESCALRKQGREQRFGLLSISPRNSSNNLLNESTANMKVQFKDTAE